MGIYLAENQNAFPAAYIYTYMTFDGTNQTPAAPTWGYTNWSSFLYQNKANNSNPNTFTSLDGWSAFQCPEIENGGLPPTDTYQANMDAGQIADAKGNPGQAPHTDWNGYDYQAPRLGYTVNEALCPRNKFAPIHGESRLYQFVRVSMVKNSSGTILATEWTNNSQLVVAPGEIVTDLVVKSHRPVSGFAATGPGVTSSNDLTDLAFIYPAGGGGMFGRSGGNIHRVTVNDLQPNPTPGATSSTRLDWVGRNHGTQRLDSRGFNIKYSNFLYVDGHVETKNIRDTLTPNFEWGARVYSLRQGDDIAK
jgi:prepilin-type processing-associated H-X9-DG protein